jgi:hypothetical protein
LALVCSENWLVIERTTSSSSAHARTCGKRSLTGVPQVPPGLNAQGPAKVLPLLLNWVRSIAIPNG